VELFTRKSSNRDGLENKCIECRAHDRRLSTYDLSPQEYTRLGYLQNWQCAICRTAQNELERGLFVDHSHATGEVRSLLCHFCNSGLGMFKDRVDLLVRAKEYVELWEVSVDGAT
jgi:hypothetical protein